MVGNIPYKLKLFVCNPKSITINYDDLDLAIGAPIAVNETFVSDADNAKTCETGKAWAENNQIYDRKTQKYSKLGYTVEEMDNTPTNNVRITSLEHRGNGGRAYKVIVNDKYYVDLREDVLLDTILNAGIDSGGKLKGQYIWGKVGSAMKLVRVNSALHEELIKSTEINTMTKIKNLEIGRVYESKTQTLLYLGKFKTTVFKLDNAYPSRYRAPQSDGNLSYKDETGMLFLECSYDGKFDFTNSYQYKFSKSHALKLDTNQTIAIPNNWLENLKKSIVRDGIATSNTYPEIKKLKYGEIYYLVNESQLINLNELHPMFQKALTL